MWAINDLLKMWQYFEKGVTKPFSFDTFSDKKVVLKTPAWFDHAAKYPSHKGKLKIFK